MTDRVNGQGANGECNAGTTDRQQETQWVCLVNALGRRWHRQMVWVTGPHYLVAAGQHAQEMENYQLAGSQVLRQGMGVGCKGESLDVMQKPGWVVCPGPDAARGLDFGALDSSRCLFSLLLVTGWFTRC
ncbi:hypothetical protein V8C34DRAFT_269193 [Trichoderma compactum]